MSDADLIARACDTIASYLALGNETVPAHGAVLVRNRSTPRRYDANHVGRIRTDSASQLEALLHTVGDAFEGIGHRRFDVDPLTPPPVVARLMLEGGFKTTELLSLLLEGKIRAQPRDIEIREVLSEADWRTYRGLDELWWRETGVPYLGPYDPALHDEFMASKRLKALVARTWLAYSEGAPAAFLSSWPGENGIGMLEDMFTHPAQRHRGLATALLAHGVTDARERGAGPVVINADPGDTPKRIYAALGFRPLLTIRNYLQVAAGSSNNA